MQSASQANKEKSTHLWMHIAQAQVCIYCCSWDSSDHNAKCLLNFSVTRKPTMCFLQPWVWRQRMLSEHSKSAFASAANKSNSKDSLRERCVRNCIKMRPEVYYYAFTWTNLRDHVFTQQQRPPCTEQECICWPTAVRREINLKGTNGHCLQQFGSILVATIALYNTFPPSEWTMGCTHVDRERIIENWLKMCDCEMVRQFPLVAHWFAVSLSRCSKQWN